jgi:hypothetical protein
MSKKKKPAKKSKPLRGKALLRAAMNQIILHPEKWDQTTYHCRTKHCLAGWCQILGGRSKEEIKAINQGEHPEIEDCHHDARDMLGIGDETASNLFYGENNLLDLMRMVGNVLGQKPKITYGLF